jgi:hypothetical protein
MGAAAGEAELLWTTVCVCVKFVFLQGLLVKWVYRVQYNPISVQEK